MQRRISLLISFLVAVVAAACGSGGTVSNGGPSAAQPERAPEVRVSADVDAAEPAIAADAQGNIYVLYVEHPGGGPAGLFVQKYDKDLKPAGERVAVSPGAAAKTWRGDPPSAAVGPDGSLYVGWTRTGPEGKGTDLVVSVSRDGGRSFAEPVKVNDDTQPVSHGMHSIGVSQDGRVYLAWLDERNVKASPHMANAGDTQPPMRMPGGYRIVQAHHNDEHNAKPSPTPNAASEAEPNSEVFFSYSTDGGKTFSANKRIASDVCPCCKTSMLAAADGRVYVSWRQVLPGDLRHIAVASTADEGATFSDRVIVSDDQWRLHACPVSGAALTDAGGKIQVTWYTAGNAGQAGLYSAESADGGRSFGPRRLVSAEAAAGTPVAFGDLQTCLFATGGNAISIGSGHEAAKIENATLPAATTVGGRIVTAFVRPQGEKRSVWLAAIR